MRRFCAVSILLAILFASTLPVYAHHSFTAEFDGSKLVTLTGVLTKIEWENPHVWFYIDVKDDTGNAATWAVESVSPNHLRNQSPSARADFSENIGKAMSATVCPAKRGMNKANGRFVKFATGKIMRVGVDSYHGPLDPEQILRDLK